MSLGKVPGKLKGKVKKFISSQVCFELIHKLQCL